MIVTECFHLIIETIDTSMTPTRLIIETIDTSSTEISTGRWHLFTGNELGALLGYWQIKRWKESLENRLVEEHPYEEVTDTHSYRTTTSHMP